MAIKPAWKRRRASQTGDELLQWLADGLGTWIAAKQKYTEPRPPAPMRAQDWRAENLEGEITQRHESWPARILEDQKAGRQHAFRLFRVCTGRGARAAGKGLGPRRCESTIERRAERGIMRILVTGGAGFIGSHVADAYLAAGHEVGVVDDLSTGTRENLDPRASFWQVDIRSADLEAILADFRPDVINHHAAQMSVSASVRDPRRDADINILGTLNLLEAAVRHGVARVVFASTGGAMYGDQDAVPTAETVFPRPVSPYGVAKLAAERYLHAYQAMHGLRAIALRYANVYGPRQNPHGEAGVVAIFSRGILEGRELTVNGDGAQTRDYVYVGDVVRANLLALECREPSAESRVDPQATHVDSQSPDPRIMNHEPSAIRNERRAGGPPLVLNIGTGIETSVNDLVRLFGEVAGKDVPWRHGPPRPGEQRRSALDCALAKLFLGWEATTDLRRGLMQTFRWFEQRSREA